MTKNVLKRFMPPLNLYINVRMSQTFNKKLKEMRFSKCYEIQNFNLFGHLKSRKHTRASSHSK